MKKLFLLVCIISPWLSSAQNPPLFRQFYANPFFINPAFVGADKENTVTVFHRKQWLAIQDAPTTTGFGFNGHAGRRLGLGLIFYTQRTVALQNNSLETTFSYSIPFKSATSMHFGLSAGIGQNSLDVDVSKYVNDPAILQAAANDVYVEGRFGFLFKHKTWEIGVALPRLFDHRYISPGRLNNSRYAQLLNQIYSISNVISYKHVDVKPYALYRLNMDLNQTWEAGAAVYYRKRIWFGSAYHRHQGAAFFIGSMFRDFSFNYNFEIPTSRSMMAASSSHEISLSYSFDTGKSTAIRKEGQ